MPTSRRAFLAATTVTTAALSTVAGCLGSREGATAGRTRTSTRPPEGSSNETGSRRDGDGAFDGLLARNTTVAYTHLRASGNRVLASGNRVLAGGNRVLAGGNVADAEPVDLDVSGTPAWLLAYGHSVASGDDGQTTFWTVVTEAGTARTHRVTPTGSERLVDHGAVSTPPLGYVTAEPASGGLGVVDTPATVASATHPVPLERGWLYVDPEGDLVVREVDDGETRFDLSVPRDARIVHLDGPRYVLYGGATDRYRHGALGDSVEGSRLAVVDTDSGRLLVDRELESSVFEGLSPLAADVDGDGRREVVTTISDAARGARIRVYDADGTERATGPVYGSGWRHQLCVASFLPDGPPEIAVVRKPHVDQTLEFYRLVDGELRVTATLEGYASHTYGSRNLDGGLAADLDADGRVELLVPTTDRRQLDGVRRGGAGGQPDEGTEGDGRQGDGAAVAWSLPLDGRLSTNVGGTVTRDGLAVGAGTPDGVRVWTGRGHSTASRPSR
jgi:hypothetical protein